MNILPECRLVHGVHAWCLWKSEEGIRSPTVQLQTVGSSHVSAGNQTWVLCKRAASALNHRAVSPAPRLFPKLLKKEGSRFWS